MEKKRMDALFSLCELPPKMAQMSFETFDVLPGLEEAYRACLSFIEGGEHNWLTLLSGTDRGKTHLGIAVVRAWMAKGMLARYAYVPLLFEELRRGFRAEGDYSYEQRFDFYLNVPLLMLDDLGTENRTPWVQEKLDTIVDYRLMKNLALLVTANCPMDELPFRVRSRLQRMGEVVVIDSPEFSLRDDKGREGE